DRLDDPSRRPDREDPERLEMTRTYRLPSLRHAALAALTAAATLGLAPSRSSGYALYTTNGNKIKWSAPSRSWWVNAAGGPSGSLTAITNAMGNWTKSFTCRFAFIYAGTTSSSACATNDGVSNVCFGSLPSGVLGRCTFWYNPTTGAMVDADVVLSSNASYWPTY